MPFVSELFEPAAGRYFRRSTRRRSPYSVIDAPYLILRAAHPNHTMHLKGSCVAWQDDSALIGMDHVLPIHLDWRCIGRIATVSFRVCRMWARWSKSIDNRLGGTGACRSAIRRPASC